MKPTTIINRLQRETLDFIAQYAVDYGGYFARCRPKTIRALEAAGYINRQGDLWRVTEKGRQALAPHAAPTTTKEDSLHADHA